MPAVSSVPDLGSPCFGKSAAQQVLQADAVPARLKSNVMSHEVFGFNVGCWPKFAASAFAKWRFGKDGDSLASFSASVVSVIPELAVILGRR